VSRTSDHSYDTDD